MNPFENRQTAAAWSKIAETFEEDTFRKKFIHPAIHRWGAKTRPGDLILDVGGGTGFTQRLLPPHVDYHLLEPSEILAKQFPGTVTVGDALRIPYGAHSVDSILSVMVAFHVENLEEMMTETERVLRPGGTALIITANPDAAAIWQSFFHTVESDDGRTLWGVMDIAGHEIRNNFINHSRTDYLMAIVNARLLVSERKVFGKYKFNGQTIPLFCSLELKKVEDPNSQPAQLI
jgi:ubiquinone/menaquinone biosynthesis C-methylase UbiE